MPNNPLPNGWRRVSSEEGSKVFGKGQSPPNTGKHCSDCDEQSGDGGCSQCTGMARCNVHLAAVSLHIFDRPFFYSTPKGPSMAWQISYHQRDSYQPGNFSYSNIGELWTFNWLSYLQDDPNTPSSNVDLYVMDGGVRTFTGYNETTKSYAPEIQTNDVLVRIDVSCYELRHPDGSKEVYSNPDGSLANGRRVFLTKKVDVAGNAVTIFYDAFLRITSLKDALNQVTTLTYDNTDIFKIIQISALGRTAKFEYDGSGRLYKITDMIGMVSSFLYDSNGFITQMTTPYGTTKFTKQDGPDNFRSLQIDYPLGAKERVEFAEAVAGVPFSETIYPSGMNLFNQYINYRNTFYWDKKAMLDGAGDYTKAKIYHWLHGSSATNENTFVSPILESVKEPLENRVWYNYQNGQAGVAVQGMSSSPSIIGRVLSDGTTQLIKAGYNSTGADTFSLDASGRKISYKYDSTQINLLEVHQTTAGSNELLEKNTYDPQHPFVPKTVKDASGQTTTFTYNAAGQVLTIKNPKNEKTTFTYDGKGYLKKITGPVQGSTVSFTYDAFGRVRTVTDPEGYKITTDYDALDRPHCYYLPRRFIRTNCI